jgi:hypothetical protein
MVDGRKTTTDQLIGQSKNFAIYHKLNKQRQYSHCQTRQQVDSQTSDKVLLLTSRSTGCKKTESQWPKTAALAVVDNYVYIKVVAYNL